MPASVRSPLGSSALSYGEKKKSYVVEDPEEDMPVVNPIFNKQVQENPVQRRLSPEEFKTHRETVQNSVQNRNKLTASAKERVEFLLGIGKLYEKVEVEGATFELRSLSSRELTEINEEMKLLSKDRDAGEISDVKFMHYFRALILSYSLCSINGQNPLDIVGASRREELFEFILDLDETVAAKLLLTWNKIKGKTEKIQTTDAEQAQKVIEEIKK